MWTIYPHFLKAAALACLFALGACTTLPGDSGRSEVVRLVSDRGLAMPQSNIDRPVILKNDSLTVVEAVRHALEYNPELSVLFATLGFSAADLYDAGRIRNPVFSAALLNSDERGMGDQLSLSILASFADIVTLPARSRMANAEFAAAKQAFAFAVLDLASATQAAFYDYLAAKQTVMLRQQTNKAASLSLALAERFYKAGNISAKDIALERAAAAQASLVALRAQADQLKARSELARLLGVSPADPWETKSQLPLPPDKKDSIESLLSLALESRLDLSAARIRADYLADKLGVTNWSRWLGELSVGYEREKEVDGAILKGPALEWELPIFSFRRGDLLRAESELHAQMAELRALTLDIDREVRLAYESMNNAESQVLVFKDKLIPARIDATQRAQQEENFMLIGIFELISTKQEEYDTYEGYIEAVRDYWLARTALARSVGNKLPTDAAIGDERIDIQTFLVPKMEGMNHQMHQMPGMKVPVMKVPDENTHKGHDMGNAMKIDNGTAQSGDMQDLKDVATRPAHEIEKKQDTQHVHH